MGYRIADFHNDIMTAPGGGDLSALAGEADLCVCALFTGARSFARIEELARLFFAQRREGQFLSLEDASYLREDRIEEVCSWRPVCISLTWNGENALAGGCLAEGGLTAKGERVLREIASRGIALDCAHLNVRSFCDALDLAPRIVCSHTCMYSVHPHPRNLKDRQIREILDRGGLVGIALVRAFLGGGGDTEAVFVHFDRAVQKFGIEGFCLGTDLNGTRDLPAGLEGYAGLQRLADRFICGGYSERDVEKLFYENLKNYLAKNGCF